LSVWPDLATRLDAAELMDDRTIGGAELVQALRELRWINRLLGGAWPVREGVRRLWTQVGCPPRLSILDVGAGSGDVNRALLRWADQQALDLRITLIDIHPETCAEAAAYYQDEPRVQVQQGDLFDLAPNQADIVTASLFLHHFTDAQLPAAWSALLRAARIGVVVNDLHRHPVAWIGIRVATQLLSRNRMIRHDGPLSVRRGFQAADFMRLRSLPGMFSLTYAWRPFFRYLVIVRRV